MRNLFFYGTLCHVPLLEIVLGRSAAELDVRAAVLPGHAVYRVRGEIYPMIAPEDGASASGVLVAELSEDDVARLSHYEGGFRYDLRPVRVSCGGQDFEAEVFFPVQGQGDPGGRWSLEDWAARHGEVSMRAAQEIMGWYGRMPARELARRFGPINNRAASYVAAQGSAPDLDRDVARDVVVHAHNRPYLNFFAVEEMDLQYRRHDGTMSAVLNRAALFVGQAVVVLPYDPVRDVVLLIEQFRAPLFIAGDRAPWVWEPIAGLIDRGEAPFRAAVREAEEEAGLVLGRLEPAGGVYSSTGSSTEFLHLFIGISDLPDIPEGGGGLDGEGEDIRAEILSYDALMRGVDAHSYRDMPLLTCALWLARHRDRLRAEAGISGSA